MPKFDLSFLSAEDRKWVVRQLGGKLPVPDLVIAPDGIPYLYRWFLTPKDPRGSTYLHIQVASDPHRPLHDHPADSMSNIVSGGYEEVMGRPGVPPIAPVTVKRRAGDVVFRVAEQPHRLILPPNVPYTITLFHKGRVRRDWGFWFGTRWVSYKDCVAESGGQSVFAAPKGVR